MKHIVFFKFEEGADLSKISDLISGTYEKLKNDHKVILDYDFKLDILKNGQNMDIALFVELENIESLPLYIDHPLHQEFLKEFKASGLVGKSAVDVEL